MVMQNVRQERRTTGLVEFLRKRPRKDFDKFLTILASDGINRIDIREKLQAALDDLDRGKTIINSMII